MQTYVGADLNLVDRARAPLEGWQAIGIGLMIVPLAMVLKLRVAG